jgi:hypothetical protein
MTNSEIDKEVQELGKQNRELKQQALNLENDLRATEDALQRNIGAINAIARLRTKEADKKGKESDVE